MSAPFTRWPVTLTPLSPIHIGSGEELDWTRAIPVGRELVVFDPLRVELPPTALAEMVKAADGRASGDAAVLALQKLFKAHSGAFRAAAASRVAMTGAVADKFEKALGHNVQQQGTGRETVVNQLALSRHAIVAGDGRPYVPGSSLKGALRTAEVARLDYRENPTPPPGPRPDFRDPSDDLLGRFQNSPFSRVLLSDLLPQGNVTALAAQVRNVRRKRKEGVAEKGLPVSVELIPPFLPCAFRGDIRIAGKRGRGDQAAVPDLGQMMTATHAFHFELFQFFAKVLQQEQRGLPAGWLAGVRQLLAEESLAAAIREGRAALVRLGKFCSAESKTVAWRSVFIPQAQPPAPKRVLHPYTLWLAELGTAGNLPLGWAILELAEEASQPVVEFCNRFRASPETDAEAAGGGDHQPPPPPPAAPRIVTDASPPNRSRLAMLETQADEGRDMHAMLENLSRQAKTWPAEDLTLFARLYHEKLRDKLKPHMQRMLDQRLPKPQ